MNAEPSPKRLEIRVTDHCVPITVPQTTFVPQESEYCYNNSLAALERNDESLEINFRFKDGKGTQKGFYRKEGQRWVEFDPERQVKTIEICYNENDSRCFGLRLIDTNQLVIAEASTEFFTSRCAKIKKFELEQGERILGIKCRHKKNYPAHVFDLQFVLGKLV